MIDLKDLFGWLVGFLTSSSATRLSRRRVPRLTSENCTCCQTDQSWETMTSVSAGHIILTPIKPVGSGRCDRTHDLLTWSRTLYPLNYRIGDTGGKTGKVTKSNFGKNDHFRPAEEKWLSDHTVCFAGDFHNYLPLFILRRPD